jgi:DNA-directed RNA polymerase sigma subunit (sigma70/sigma32)
MSSYNTPLVNSVRAAGCVSSSRQENDALYPQVAAGDEAAIKRMIESNVGLVIDRVESYIRVFPPVAYLRDDLVSEGLLSLTIAVNRMAEEGPKENPNPNGYMSYWITKAIGAVVSSEGSISIPESQTRVMKNRGDSIPKYVSLPIEERSIDPRVMIELRDLIESCCETPEDRMIVEMREKGYVDKEIAAQLNLPHTTVYMMRRDIYARFLEKSGMKGEV